MSNEGAQEHLLLSFLLLTLLNMAEIFEDMRTIFNFNLAVMGLCCEKIIEPVIVRIAGGAKFFCRAVALALAACFAGVMIAVYTPVQISMHILRCGYNYSIAGCKMGFEVATRVCGKLSSMATRVATRLRRRTTSTTQAEES